MAATVTVAMAEHGVGNVPAGGGGARQTQSRGEAGRDLYRARSVEAKETSDGER